MTPRLLLLALVVVACAKRTPQAPSSVIAPLADARGRIVGNAVLSPGAQGVDVVVKAYALPRDTQWTLALHQGGSCGGHSFSEAGPAWRPPGASASTQFGPLVPDERGRAVLHASDSALTLAGTVNGVLGKTALLIPAQGEPIPRACGQLAPPPEQEVRVSGEQPELTEAWEL